MIDSTTLDVSIRDGMFAERAGIEGWQPADAALRTRDWGSLDELVGELKAQGFSVHPGVFASGTYASPMAEVLIGGLGGLTGLAAVLRAWFHRHDGKKIHFEFNDHQIDLAGLSEKELGAVLRSLSRFDRAALESDETEESGEA